MRESNGRYEQSGGAASNLPSNVMQPLHAVGGGSGEITSPAINDILPPDPMYGDIPVSQAQEIPVIPPEHQPTETDPVVPDYANYHTSPPSPEPRPSRAVEPRGDIRPASQERRPVAHVTERSVAAPEKVKFTCYVNIDDKPKHVRQVVARKPQSEADEVRLMQAYFEEIRHRGPYSNELKPTDFEADTLGRYIEAQRRVADKLGVLGNVEYDVTHTPYHVLPDKAAVNAIVRVDASKAWLTRTGGAYTPLTGALWPRYEQLSEPARDPRMQQRPEIAGPGAVRRAVARGGPQAISGRRDQESQALTPRDAVRELAVTQGNTVSLQPADRQRTERGLARLLVESSATFMGVPHRKNGGIQTEKGSLQVAWGIGYKRPDLIPDLSHDGLHRATTDMAAARVLQEGGFDGELRWQNYALDSVLDGVIRGVAERRGRRPDLVADTLLKGYYAGDLRPIQGIFNDLPRGARLQLLNLDGSERTNEIRVIADTLQLPRIAQTYRALRAGQRPPLFKW